MVEQDLRERGPGRSSCFDAGQLGVAALSVMLFRPRKDIRTFTLTLRQKTFDQFPSAMITVKDRIRGLCPHCLLVK